MKIILVAVSSLDGKTTKGDDSNIYSWTSKEDSKLFFSMIEEHNLIVMGSKTYEAARNIIKHKKNKLRIVLTRNPKRYEGFAVRRILEFSNESPRRLINRLEKLGYKKMLLVGGSEVYTQFLKSFLVDELHITIEPYIFGSGKNLVLDEALKVSLKILDIKKLNSNGTLHLRYRVNKLKSRD